MYPSERSLLVLQQLVPRKGSLESEHGRVELLVTGEILRPGSRSTSRTFSLRIAVTQGWSSLLSESFFVLEGRRAIKRTSCSTNQYLEIDLSALENFFVSEKHNVRVKPRRPGEPSCQENMESH